MRQAVMIKPGEVKLHDIPKPQAGAGEVLLHIKHIGVCGSDIHVNHGLHPFTSYPVVQGHEFSAVVAEVGEGVVGVSLGQKVTARPQVVCGKCPPCRRGDYHICDNLKVEGFQAPGVAQDYFVTSAEKLHFLPDSMTMDQGALVEPTSVATHSTARAGDLMGKNVLVLGAGPIGNLIAQVAQSRGAAKVLIRDISDFRLEIAQACGLEHVSNAKNETMVEAKQRVFGDEGYGVAFEAVGVEATMDDAIQTIDKGGTIMIVGVFGEKPRIDMSIVGDREISLVGTLMYRHEDYELAIEFIDSGKVVTEPLITKRFPLESYQEAYEFIDAQGDKSLKVIIDL